MKTLMLCFLTLTITACADHKNTSATRETIKQDPLIAKCLSKVTNNDLFDAAVAANKVRVECGLTEDQAVAFVSSL